MQDRFAGDVGDFVKLGLLRNLSPGRTLGVAWYRVPDETGSKDGQNTSYLDKPHLYRALDADLFDHMGNVIRGHRTIAGLQAALPGAVHSDEALDLGVVPAALRPAWRRDWFQRVLTDLSACDLVFADPDNGMVDDADHRRRTLEFRKQIALEEVRSLAKGRCAVIYHHNTRRAGGHDAEVDHWLSEIGLPGLAVRAKAFSPRTFFVLNPTEIIAERLRAFCHRWRDLNVHLHVPGDA